MITDKQADSLINAFRKAFENIGKGRKLVPEPKDTVKTTNFKAFQHKECEFFPCHGDPEQNCLFCYCPLAWLECPGQYTVIESPKGVFRKDCSQCTLTHGKKGWEVVQRWLKIPKRWDGC